MSNRNEVEMSTKSKEIIVNTFLEILKNNAYEDITISEVLANTPLVRKTFYNNFSSKDDIVRYICCKLMTEYMTRLTSGTEFSLYAFSSTFYEFGKENGEIFSLLFKHKLFHIFTAEFGSQMESINSIMPQSILNSLSDEDANYVFAFHASGTLAMFEIWVNSGFKKTIDEMAEMYTFIVRDVRGSL